MKNFECSVPWKCTLRLLSPSLLCFVDTISDRLMAHIISTPRSWALSLVASCIWRLDPVSPSYGWSKNTGYVPRLGWRNLWETEEKQRLLLMPPSPGHHNVIAGAQETGHAFELPFPTQGSNWFGCLIPHCFVLLGEICWFITKDTAQDICHCRPERNELVRPSLCLIFSSKHPVKFKTSLYKSFDQKVKLLIANFILSRCSGSLVHKQSHRLSKVTIWRKMWQTDVFHEHVQMSAIKTQKQIQVTKTESITYRDNSTSATQLIFAQSKAYSSGKGLLIASWASCVHFKAFWWTPFSGIRRVLRKVLQDETGFQIKHGLCFMHSTVIIVCGPNVAIIHAAHVKTSEQQSWSGEKLLRQLVMLMM